jgi:perosamine synthetase
MDDNYPKGKALIKYRSSFPYFNEETIDTILHGIRSTLSSGYLSLGPVTEKFEDQFGEYTKKKYAIAVNSGAMSIEIALRYFGVQNKEILVPTNTFVATPNSVIFAGGKPVFCDAKEETLCIDPEQIKNKITLNTKGVIVVHIAGLVCPEIEEIVELCRSKNLFLIEDCAHAHGATMNGKMAGCFGDAGCFSFAPTKVMTTGEGGMIITDNKELARYAKIVRNRGLDKRHLMVELGGSWVMSEIAAIVGIQQLKSLDYSLVKRNEVASKYISMLAGVSGISLIKVPSNVVHSYHKFPVRLNSKLDCKKIADHLLEKYGIETSLAYYPPCHMHPYYAKSGIKEGDFPVAENVLKQVICLPIHLALTDEDIKYVSNALIDVVRSQ